MVERGGVGPSKKSSFYCKGLNITAPQIPLGQ